MRLISIVMCICALLTCFAETITAKPWKGIFPLKTTRAEVIKLLGRPKGVAEFERAVFSSTEGTVTVGWKRPECVLKDLFWSESDADDTALVYQITLEPNVKIESIDSFEKSDPVAAE